MRRDICDSSKIDPRSKSFYSPSHASHLARVTGPSDMSGHLATHPCSLTSLPHELLEMILSHLHPGENRVYTSAETDALHGLLATMQTCRALHAAGRAVLYAVPPIRESAPPRLNEVQFKGNLRRAANRLVETLKRDEVASRSVKDLWDLRTLVGGFHDIKGISPTQRLALIYHQDALNMQATCLRICTILQKVSLALADRKHAEKTGKALAGLVHLKHLELYVQHPPSTTAAPRLGSDLFEACLAGLAVGAIGRAPLDGLHLDGDIHDCAKSPCNVGQSVCGRAKELFLNLSYAPYANALDCYLSGLLGGAGGNTLSGLALTTFVPADSSVSGYDFFGTLMYYLADHRLTAFEIDATNEVQPPRTGADYSEFSALNRTYRRVTYPDTLFGFFPCIEELRLTKGRAMTLQKLNRLVETSPDLRVLDLAETMWTIDPPELLISVPGSLSTYEIHLTQILDKLPKLRKINLGVWPFAAGSGWFFDFDIPPERAGLSQWAAERGVVVKVEGCARSE
ncbi:hypothetical protein BMF94_4914 [Rhodotorula taiwanensis]|uniref:F-box domain-containing protein n=1 Tax=Rhodotorula taiwanensis TaxID=741276 RepID=A0A2S5B5I2_9BASI|nr:hypothetical protein BMF94_4914 [Rhodotorula taiwanensis]